jgi:hypothetical protein
MCGRGGGGNRLSAYASSPCYLCVAAALAVSEALSRIGASFRTEGSLCLNSDEEPLQHEAGAEELSAPVLTQGGSGPVGGTSVGIYKGHGNSGLAAKRQKPGGAREGGWRRFRGLCPWRVMNMHNIREVRTW